jgi:hypothetical protein
MARLKTSVFETPQFRAVVERIWTVSGSSEYVDLMVGVAILIEYGHARVRSTTIKLVR